MSYFGFYTGPWWLITAAYVGTFLVAGLVLFVVATVTGFAEWVGSLPGRLAARNERIVREREERR